MSIWVESQTVIQCDTCQDTYIEVRTRRSTIKLARECGWKTGKVVTCPKCSKLDGTKPVLKN